MNFTHTARVAANRDRLWDFLMDIAAVGACIPGVESLRAVDADTYVAVQKIKVGPIGLRFEGRMTVVERDPREGRAMVRIEGADKGAGGAVKAVITMSISELGPGESELRVDTHADVLGKLGEFGLPVMKKKGESLFNEFTRNLAGRMA